MYKVREKIETKLNVNNSSVGELIEQKVQRITENNEPINDGVEMIYTERKDGVLPQYNMRTDKWDIALDAMTKIAESSIKYRNEKLKIKETDPKEIKSEEGITE